MISAIDYGITPRIVNKALKKATRGVKLLKRKLPNAGVKNLSEMLSKDLEGIFANLLTKSLRYPVTNPSSDNDPDLYFTNHTSSEKAVEIKVTSGEKWRGGEFSKRSSPTLLVSWDPENIGTYYVSFLMLRKSDWISSSSASYYAPTFGKKELFSRSDREDLRGSLSQGSRAGTIILNRT